MHAEIERVGKAVAPGAQLVIALLLSIYFVARNIVVQLRAFVREASTVGPKPHTILLVGR